MSTLRCAASDDLISCPVAFPAHDPPACWAEPGVIHVVGAIDENARAMFARALSACETDPCVQALDLAGVDFFSSAGVRCFVERGWTVRPHVPIIASSIVRRVLSMCEMVYLLDQHGWRHA
jgi:anti-anti-sigma regulatory factor